MSEHIIKMPLWFWILKIVQFVMAFLILGFSAYGVHYYAWNSVCFSLFCALWTMLVIVYYGVSVHFLHAAYNWIAVLALESISTIFWLSAWACLASTYAAGVNWYTGGYGYYNYTNYYRKRDITTLDTYINVFRANLAFSVLIFLTFIATLVFFSLAVHKHRVGGAPIMAGGATDVEKHEIQNVGAPAAVPVAEHQYAQPQPQYGAPQQGYEQPYVSPPASSAPYTPAGSPPPQQPPPNVHEAM